MKIWLEINNLIGIKYNDLDSLRKAIINQPWHKFNKAHVVKLSAEDVDTKIAIVTFNIFERFINYLYKDNNFYLLSLRTAFPTYNIEIIENNNVADFFREFYKEQIDKVDQIDKEKNEIKEEAPQIRKISKVNDAEGCSGTYTTNKTEGQSTQHKNEEVPQSCKDSTEV